MSCAPRTPVFWQRQPKLPLPVQRFLGARVDAALRDPADRALLVWPMVLGAPRHREAWPEGIGEAGLLAKAEAMVLAAGATDAAAAWRDALERMPDTADAGPEGWVPHRIWDPLGSLVSLRLGSTLLSLLGQPEDERYPLCCGVALFNNALFHECHDALEVLWTGAEGPLKAGLQGLIMMAAGYHHLQVQNPRGMISLWRDAAAALEGCAGILRTPWGDVDYRAAQEATDERMAWLDHYDGDAELEPLWGMPRPEWELL